MRTYPECLPCMLHRALVFCEGEDEEKRFEVARRVCSLLSQEATKVKTIPLAYRRDRIVKEVIGEKDYMLTTKLRAFKEVEQLYPKLKALVEAKADDCSKLLEALRIAAIGNSLEHGVLGYQAELELERNLEVDERQKIVEGLLKAEEVLYVLDNAPELWFDKVLIELLEGMGKELTLSPLERPFQDDACVEDLRRVDLKARIVPRPYLGVWFDVCGEELLDCWEASDFRVAKGMACYETLVDHQERWDGRTGLLMAVKCSPVAKDLGVKRGSLVAKVL